MKRSIPFLLLFAFFHVAWGQAQTGFQHSMPEAEGISSEGILSFVTALEQDIDAVHSFMLLRHGKVVAAGWWAPYAADDLHVMYSVTKSFNATAVGFAVQEGLLDVDDRVLSFFPDLAPANPSPNMAAMRIRDLLTMNSGHQDDTMDLLRARTDGQWRRAFLETDVEHEPGTFFRYNSGASYMLAAIVQQVTGMTVRDYLQPRLFEPLGIDTLRWGMSPEGVNLGAGGLYVRTEDLAKLGQLYLQKGKWNGRQLLSAAWVEAATARQTSSGDDPDSNWGHGYGYQFWRNKVTGFRADGALGQFSFVLPEQDVVLAVTSGTTDMSGVMDIVWDHLLPAIHDERLPDNPSAYEKLTGKLNTLTLPVPEGAARSPRMNEVSGMTYDVEENVQGIETLTIDFSPEQPVLMIEDADGMHRISVGLGAWLRGHTGFKKRVNELFDTEEQGLAAAGAWTDDDTFTAKLCFDETPYILTAAFHFEGERLLVDMVYNVRWGERAYPQLIATSANHHP